MDELGTQCQQGMFLEPPHLSAQAQVHSRADLLLCPVSLLSSASPTLVTTALPWTARGF